MRIQLPSDNEGILKASELTDDPWGDYVGTYTDVRNDQPHEYKFRAQNDSQAMQILKAQTEHRSAVVAPSRSRSIYVNLEVHKA